METIPQKPVTERIVIMGKPMLLELSGPLVAMGLDWDGKIKPIAEMTHPWSYTCTLGISPNIFTASEPEADTPLLVQTEPASTSCSKPA